MIKVTSIQTELQVILIRLRYNQINYILTLTPMDSSSFDINILMPIVWERVNSHVNGLDSKDCVAYQSLCP